MKADLYEFVGDKIIEFCDNTYYGDIVFSFEQSYDGKNWTKEFEFATFYNGTNLCYQSDWNEGQTHIQNLRIWHLEDSEPIKHGRWMPSDKGDCTYTCSECGFFCDAYLLEKKAYCPNCGAKMDL